MDNPRRYIHILILEASEDDYTCYIPDLDAHVHVKTNFVTNTLIWHCDKKCHDDSSSNFAKRKAFNDSYKYKYTKDSIPEGAWFILREDPRFPEIDQLLFPCPKCSRNKKTIYDVIPTVISAHIPAQIERVVIFSLSNESTSTDEYHYDPYYDPNDTIHHNTPDGSNVTYSSESEPPITDTMVNILDHFRFGPPK